jgi:hypothetical protein
MLRVREADRRNQAAHGIHYPFGITGATSDKDEPDHSGEGGDHGTGAHKQTVEGAEQ